MSQAAFQPQVGSPQVIPFPQAPTQIQATPQYQSPQQLVNPYLSTGLTPQSFQIPQYNQPINSGGWVSNQTPMAVQPQNLAAVNYGYPQEQTLIRSTPQYQTQSQYQPQFNLNAPTGKSAKGESLASVLEIMNAFGGAPEVVIANLHNSLIEYEEKLIELATYTKQLEATANQALGELKTLGQILSTPEETGKYLQYQEFNLAQIPETRAFRTLFPQATFENFYEMGTQYQIFKAQNPEVTQIQFFELVAQQAGGQAQQQVQQTQNPNLYVNEDPRYGGQYVQQPNQPTVQMGQPMNQMQVGANPNGSNSPMTGLADAWRTLDAQHFGNVFATI